MTKLSTHVLDTMHGSPAGGMKVQFYRLDTGSSAPVWQLINELVLNADGRNDGGPLLDAKTMAVGRYKLCFHVADYFRAKDVKLPEPAFIDVVPIEFGIAEATGNYHVPLLVSPWSYSTYRGS